MTSIIIVHYRVKKELYQCIESIVNNNPKIEYEIIVVDNDEIKNLGQVLKKKFPKVIYIPNENKGFGYGNNVGAKKAKGKYLFFLNPDTVILNNCIGLLSEFLGKHKEVGIVSPLLLDKRLIPYPLQGSKKLTPIYSIFTQSFISKLFPNNFIFKKYWYQDWDKKSVQGVESIPGTAFVIRKSLFEKMKGFDEKFFLYFEESDFCKRVKDEGSKIFIVPRAKTIHFWGSSTKKSNKNIKKIFEKSRFYYFKKHFGVLSAIFTEGFLRINKYVILMAIILAVGAFLRIYHIKETMPFIGDQGWFYLSARDMLLTGQISLVGIASSHPWLHQGAYWTYILAIGLLLFTFSPFAGAYITMFIDLLAILAIYKLGSEMFSKRLGLIAAALYATSPLVIQNARMPYHTSPIPLFTIIAIYCLYKWINGSRYFFPLLILILGILYNFELATALLGFVVMITLLYGLFKRQEWALGILDKRVLFLSFLALAGSMLPILIYDYTHGFPQTLGFLAWMGYRLLILFGYPAINPIIPVTLGTMFSFFAEKYTQLTYPFSSSLALLIFVVSNIYLFIRLRRMEKNVIVLAIFNLLMIGGVFIAKTPSDAYLPMLFPGLILTTSLFFDWGFESKKFRDIIIPLFFLILLFNCFYMGYRIYVKDNDSFVKRLDVVRYIVEKSGGREYSLKGRGAGSQFESFTMNYEYLLWWKGHPVSNKPEKVKILISEDSNGIHIDNKSR